MLFHENIETILVVVKVDLVVALLKKFGWVEVLGF